MTSSDDIESQKANYENKISDIKKSYETIILSKQQQIDMLQRIIDNSEQKNKDILEKLEQNKNDTINILKKNNDDLKESYDKLKKDYDELKQLYAGYKQSFTDFKEMHYSNLCKLYESSFNNTSDLYDTSNKNNKCTKNTKQLITYNKNDDEEKKEKKKDKEEKNDEDEDIEDYNDDKDPFIFKDYEFPYIGRQELFEPIFYCSSNNYLYGDTPISGLKLLIHNMYFNKINPDDLTLLNEKNRLFSLTTKNGQKVEVNINVIMKIILHHLDNLIKMFTSIYDQDHDRYIKDNIANWNSYVIGQMISLFQTLTQNLSSITSYLIVRRDDKKHNIKRFKEIIEIFYPTFIDCVKSKYIPITEEDRDKGIIYTYPRFCLGAYCLLPHNTFPEGFFSTMTDDEELMVTQKADEKAKKAKIKAAKEEKEAKEIKEEVKEKVKEEEVEEAKEVKEEIKPNEPNT